MTGTTRSSADLSERRRRLLFRSWHRGIRETDLLLGRFADAHIGDMTDGDLDEYERLFGGAGSRHLWLGDRRNRHSGRRTIPDCWTVSAPSTP